jgi:glycosyltransferase involved in cell wall biosynthesis
MTEPAETPGPAWQLVAGAGEWVALDPLAPAEVAAAEQALERLRGSVPDRAAAIRLPPANGRVPGLRLWRRDHLLMVLRSGLVAPPAGLAELARAAERHAFIHQPGAAGAAEPTALPRRGCVLLVSSFGIRRFGGAEHFLAQMARLYAALGFQPLIVGTRPEFLGQSGQQDGLDYTYVAARPEALLRLAVERQAVLAHVVSGLGHEVAAALRFLDMRLVFGVHFWRELFFSRLPDSGYYPGGPAAHAPRPSFPLLLADYDAVYANSEFTRGVVEAEFGARVPVIPSLADDRPEEPALPEGRDHVLLANARADKGFDLMLDIAALLPAIRFRAIASQSEGAAARNEIAARGLANVEILPPVEDMAPLYRSARVVLVPSYRFVETFSRVVIEAHRHGVPVLGSDRGNVGLLLRESGAALPPDPLAWAEELRRLWTDPAHWLARSRAALENSRRHPFAAQSGRLERLLRGLDAPMLVGAGSGAGNLLHVTPLLRNLARRLGHPVDVVVAGDWPGSLCLVADPEHVRHVFLLSDVPVRRRYDTVFLTHSFGPLVPSFRAGRVVASRDWDGFHPGHRLHEAEFNLAAAQALLGVPYEPEDVRAASVGGIRYAIPATRRIGLHAGSKSGAWAQKRWPHFGALAALLAAEGYEVVSFGTPDEYVPGTLDLTGGSIEEMARRMLDCRAFVANDSGVMNIANALGMPTLALFGPTSARTRGPLGRHSVVLAVAKPCAPCELGGAGSRFRAGTCNCIADIHITEVWHALRELLWRTAPPAEAMQAATAAAVR